MTARGAAVTAAASIAARAAVHASAGRAKGVRSTRCSLYGVSCFDMELGSTAFGPLQLTAVPYATLSPTLRRSAGKNPVGRSRPGRAGPRGLRPSPRRVPDNNPDLCFSSSYAGRCRSWSGSTGESGAESRRGDARERGLGDHCALWRRLTPCLSRIREEELMATAVLHEFQAFLIDGCHGRLEPGRR